MIKALVIAIALMFCVSEAYATKPAPVQPKAPAPIRSTIKGTIKTIRKAVSPRKEACRKHRCRCGCRVAAPC